MLSFCGWMMLQTKSYGWLRSWVFDVYLAGIASRLMVEFGGFIEKDFGTSNSARMKATSTMTSAYHCSTIVMVRPSALSAGKLLQFTYSDTGVGEIPDPRSATVMICKTLTWMIVREYDQTRPTRLKENMKIHLSTPDEEVAASKISRVVLDSSDFLFIVSVHDI